MAYARPKARKGMRVNEMLPAGTRLGTLLSALGNSEKAMLSRLWQNWEMVMGPEIAPLASPLGARESVLVIGGEDNLVLQDLSYMKEEMLERANAFMDAPVFQRIDLQLLMGRNPLDLPPDIYPSFRERPVPERPLRLGGPLEKMDPESPVTRAYLAYLHMFGLSVG